jgi:hypothetical protein
VNGDPAGTLGGSGPMDPLGGGGHGSSLWWPAIPWDPSVGHLPLECHPANGGPAGTLGGRRLDGLPSASGEPVGSLGGGHNSSLRQPAVLWAPTGGLQSHGFPPKHLLSNNH